MIQSLLASNDLTLIVSKARELIKRVWNFTKPVLCAAAPDCSYIEDDHNKGTIPDHEEARAQNLFGTHDDDNDADEDLDQDSLGVTANSTGPMHKTVLSVCWRSMKEARYLTITCN